MTDQSQEGESQDRKLADKFYEAVRTGNRAATAQALRQLALLDIEVKKDKKVGKDKKVRGIFFEVLERLAELLERIPAAKDSVFPWRLTFSKSSGKPHDRLKVRAEKFSLAMGLQAELAKPGLINKKHALKNLQERLEKQAEKTGKRRPSRSKILEAHSYHFKKRRSTESK